MPDSLDMSKKDKLKELQEAEDTLDTICAHVANGGSLIELCQTWDVSYGHMTNWIRSDKEREDRYIDAKSDRLEWSQERILMELRRIGLANVADIYDDNGNIKDPSLWPEELSAIVQSFETTYDKDGDKILKVKFWSKEKALELLGKNLSMFVEQRKVDVTMTLEDLIGGSREDGGQ